MLYLKDNTSSPVIILTVVVRFLPTQKAAGINDPSRFAFINDIYA
jgi:hypothetical protein